MHFQIEFSKNVKKKLQMTSIWVGSNTEQISKKCNTHYLFALCDWSTFTNKKHLTHLQTK